MIGARYFHLLSPTLLVAAFALFQAAAAHAEMESVDPAHRSVLTQPPAEVRIVFTEPVEVPFGLFKVYRLETPLSQGTAEPNEREWLRLSGLAAELVAEKMSVRDDAQERADTGVVPGPQRSEEVVLGLREELDPGAYVVMWRVLSIDTHMTQDFVVFVVGEETTGGE